VRHDAAGDAVAVEFAAGWGTGKNHFLICKPTSTSEESLCHKTKRAGRARPYKGNAEPAGAGAMEANVLFAEMEARMRLGWH